MGLRAGVFLMVIVLGPRGGSLPSWSAQVPVLFGNLCDYEAGPGQAAAMWWLDYKKQE
jgi:hypothetical protein